MFKLEITQASTCDEIKKQTAHIFDQFNDILPALKSTGIFIKPNFNANMNALTGNTTDLRLLVAVIEQLKQRGYKNIAIGEGANSGYYRNNISVMVRLKVDGLAQYYGVKLIDLNNSEPVYIDFENGVKAGVARECFDAGFFINLPKLKTHVETGMSVCLKNLMGCLVGQENKKKTHKSLARNILHINENLKPQLHIVDGLIAMQGLGPTRGQPIKRNLIIAGTDPYLIDMACAKLADFDYRLVATLYLAEKLGFISRQHHAYLQNIRIDHLICAFEKPKANIFASFVHSPKRQKYFLAIRNTRFFTYMASTRLFGQILFLTGLRQDNFIKEEMTLDRLALRNACCTVDCGKCSDYCPMGLKVTEAIAEKDPKCIGCLYCFLVCPEKAIVFEGELGFMAEQLRQYDEITRRIT
jgi:uncharacterized protein (DUF362 family)/ferredoxin